MQADAVMSPATLEKHVDRTGSKELMTQLPTAVEAIIKTKEHICFAPHCIWYVYSSLYCAAAVHHTYVPFLFEKSPPWIMKPFMILWNGEPLKWRGSVVSLPMPASPVHSWRKFSAVWQLLHQSDR